MKRTSSQVQAACVVILAFAFVVVSRSANSTVAGTFTELGPAGIKTDRANGPRAGAINALVAHPTNPDIIWIGAVNGGVWKTTNATDAHPHWVPLTDHQASLSIGALALDPTFPNANVLVAGIGHVSSFGGRGGPLTGILRTTDGGDHWVALGEADLSGTSIVGVAPRGDVIVLATNSGVWRSRDAGATFHHLVDPHRRLTQPTTDLVGDPSNPDVLYAGITGPGGGVFRSDNQGRTWNNVSDVTFHQPSGADLVATAKKIVLSVHPANTDIIYAGIVGDDNNPSGIFRSVDRGSNWTALDIPPLEQEHQGRLSILADAVSPDIVYLGGDDAVSNGPGPNYRCNALLPRPIQCTPISGTGARDRSLTHGDSRRMQFDAAGGLLETDDGGIFRDDRPRGRGAWRSLDGDLSITETHSCVWEHLRHVATCGTQDNGTVTQPTPGAAAWTAIHDGDGGDVALFETAGVSIKYFSAQHVGGFTREVCLSVFCFDSKPALSLFGILPSLTVIDPSVAEFKGPNPAPVAAHRLHATRIAIGTGLVYESDDSGNSVTPLAGFEGLATRAMAFASSNQHDVLWVGSSAGLFQHTVRFGAMHRIDTYPGGVPTAIAFDPKDESSAWVTDSSTVRFTPDGGVSWQNHTGDLGPGGAGAQRLSTIAIVPGSSSSTIFVGASDGLYASSTLHPKQWFKLRGALPNVLVYDLSYDAVDDILLVGTIGRGAWTLSHPGAIVLGR